MKYPRVIKPTTEQGYIPMSFIIRAKDYFYSEDFTEKVSDDYIIQEFMQEEILSLLEYYMPELKDATLSSISYENVDVMEDKGEYGIVLMKSKFYNVITSTDSGVNTYLLSLIPIDEKSYNAISKNYEYSWFIARDFSRKENKFRKLVVDKFQEYVFLNDNNKLKKL